MPWPLWVLTSSLAGADTLERGHRFVICRCQSECQLAVVHVDAASDTRRIQSNACSKMLRAEVEVGEVSEIPNETLLLPVTSWA